MASYLVFGRAGFEAPLAQLGTVDADGADDASERALASHGETDWVELSLIPSDDVRWILGPAPADGEEGA